MTLVDIIEMLCDWKSANERHDNDDWHESLEINLNEHVESDELKSIIRSTAVKYF